MRKRDIKRDKRMQVIGHRGTKSNEEIRKAKERAGKISCLDTANAIDYYYSFSSKR